MQGATVDHLGDKQMPFSVDEDRQSTPGRTGCSPVYSTLQSSLVPVQPSLVLIQSSPNPVESNPSLSLVNLAQIMSKRKFCDNPSGGLSGEFRAVQSVHSVCQSTPSRTIVLNRNSESSPGNYYYTRPTGRKRMMLEARL